MKKGSVLVVEDNAVEQMLIMEAFERIGIEEKVYAVSDGDEAIDFLKRKGKYADCEKYAFPTLMLTDLKMPRVNGFELLLFLKRSQFTIIPIIILTISEDADDIKTAYLLGANAYHIKPTGMGGLVEMLRKIYEYWTSLQLPATDECGRLAPTNGTGRLSATLRLPVVFEDEE